MNKICFIPIFLIFIISLQAKEYIPLLEDGKTWQVCEIFGFANDPYEISYSKDLFDLTLSKDTIVNGYTYYQIYYQREPYALLREDIENQRVYIVPSQYDGPGLYNDEFLMYDFNVHEGDTVHICYAPSVYDTYTREFVTTSTYEENGRKIIELVSTNEINKISLKWIEGIGTMGGLVFVEFDNASNCGLGGCFHQLMCVSAHDSILYITQAAYDLCDGYLDDEFVGRINSCACPKEDSQEDPPESSNSTILIPSEQRHKYIHNGTLLIQHNEQLYDATGAKVHE